MFPKKKCRAFLCYTSWTKKEFYLYFTNTFGKLQKKEKFTVKSSFAAPPRKMAWQF